MRRHIQRQRQNQKHRRPLKVILFYITSIGKIIRVKLNKIRYGKGLYDLLSKAMKKIQLEDNILTQTAVSMQAKKKDGEVNYYSNNITV